MTCVKKGAVVWLPELCSWTVGDIFSVGNTILLIHQSIHQGQIVPTITHDLLIGFEGYVSKTRGVIYTLKENLHERRDD